MHRFDSICMLTFQGIRGRHEPNVLDFLFPEHVHIQYILRCNTSRSWHAKYVLLLHYLRGDLSQNNGAFRKMFFRLKVRVKGIQKVRILRFRVCVVIPSILDAWTPVYTRFRLASRIVGITTHTLNLQNFHSKLLLLWLWGEKPFSKVFYIYIYAYNNNNICI